MKLTKEQKSRVNISNLSLAIIKAIDKVCTEKDYEISYTEINLALADVLKGNLSHELKNIQGGKPD